MPWECLQHLPGFYVVNACVWAGGSTYRRRLLALRFAREPGQRPVASLNLSAQYPRARGPMKRCMRDTQRVNDPDLSA